MGLQSRAMKLHLRTPGGPEVNYYQVQVKLQPGVYFYYIGKVSHISACQDLSFPFNVRDIFADSILK